MDIALQCLDNALADDLRNRLDAQTFPVVVVDAGLVVVFINKPWMVYQVAKGLPPPYGLGQVYGVTHGKLTTAADTYERATVEQGIQEVLEGLQPVFSRECAIENTLGSVRYRITATPCYLRGGETGAILWHEDAGSAGRIRELIRRKHRV